MAPSLRPGDVVVMDNLASHKVEGVREAIEAADAEWWLLPPYSQDYNPIEKLWSKVMAWLRRAEVRTFDTLSSGLPRSAFCLQCVAQIHQWVDAGAAKRGRL